TNFPTIYIEGFSNCDALVKEKINNRIPEKICSIGGLYSNEFNRLFAAHLLSRGSRLHFSQHGGGYGVNHLIELEDFEKSISDIYYCWGWADGSKKLKNMPSIKLSKSIGTVASKQSKSDKILFVNTAQPKFLYRFQSQPSGSQWNKYMKDSLIFFDKLGKNLREKIEIRLYENDYGWGQKKMYLDNFPTLKFDDKKYGFDIKKYSSRLLVFDNITTTYLEGLSANLPTVIFYDPDIWEIRKEAKPYFQLLKEARIIFDKPHEAAQFIVSNFHDIENWWFSKQTQSAINKFTKRFALTSKTWEKDWAQEFNRDE
ncbi:MAG: LIC12162 family protein, partial [Candidatus Hodarchaeota archaeon]